MLCGDSLYWAGGVSGNIFWGSVGVEEAGLVRTVPSGVLLGGGDPGVSTNVSVTTRPPAVLWTATVSVGRASQATGTVKSMNSWLQQ